MAGEDKLREYLKRATVDLAEARRRLAEAEARRYEPIAVIGMACRFPGADSVVYARVDVVRVGGAPLLMELELTEPYLFLHYSDGAVDRLAAAVAAALR